MPKRSRTKKSKPRTRDANQSAFDAVQRIIELTEGGVLTPDGKDPLAVALGRRGGLKGGRARVDGMTKEELRKSAQNAARARWGHKNKRPER